MINEEKRNDDIVNQAIEKCHEYSKKSTIEEYINGLNDHSNNLFIGPGVGKSVLALLDNDKHVHCMDVIPNYIDLMNDKIYEFGLPLQNFNSTKISIFEKELGSSLQQEDFTYINCCNVLHFAINALEVDTGLDNLYSMLSKNGKLDLTFYYFRFGDGGFDALYYPFVSKDDFIENHLNKTKFKISNCAEIIRYNDYGCDSKSVSFTLTK